MLQARVAELEHKLSNCANCEKLLAKQTETDQLNKQVLAQISTLKEAISDFKSRESLNKKLLQESKEHKEEIKRLRSELKKP